MFTFHNSNEATNQNSPKRLKRMRSDFSGIPNYNSNEYVPKNITLSDKVKELELQLNKKD